MFSIMLEKVDKILKIKIQSVLILILFVRQTLGVQYRESEMHNHIFLLSFMNLKFIKCLKYQRKISTC